tara:strand:- start:480 stop:1355 length:876 start_codon:yes stop_codon:yes gene_type:complete
MTDTLRKLFFFGPGYTAQTIKLVLNKNISAYGKWTFYGSVREENQSEYLRKINIQPVPFSEAEEALMNADAILSSVPPKENGDPVINHYKNLLATHCDTKWLGYLSTTGVYGNTDGEMVAETAKLNPTHQRSYRRVRAEKEWLDLNAHIFRLPGIYGIGRSAIERIKNGNNKSVLKRGHQFSRIHVEDIAQTVISSLQKPNPGSIYNVCDDESAEPLDVDSFAARLLGLDPPEAVPFDVAILGMSKMAKSFWSDNRRVSNRKIKKELRIKLLYPTFREGLETIHKATQDKS